MSIENKLRKTTAVLASTATVAAPNAAAAADLLLPPKPEDGKPVPEEIKTSANFVQYLARPAIRQSESDHYRLTHINKIKCGLGGIAQTGFNKAQYRLAEQGGQDSGTYTLSGVEVTTYGGPWGGIDGTGMTASGINLEGDEDAHEIAVDPNDIRLGSLVFMPAKDSPDNCAGPYLAADTGGAIIGRHIDVYKPGGAYSTFSANDVPLTVMSLHHYEEMKNNEEPMYTGVLATPTAH
jgi:3D (Asp-Asp-Asp) domain-containing protein